MVCTCVQHVLESDIKADAGPVFNSDCWHVHKHITNKQEKTLLPFRWEPLNTIYFHTGLWRISKQCSEFLPCLHCADEVYRVPTSHASLLTLLMAILLGAKGWTHKNYRMAFQRCGFSYKTVTLHWMKTKIDIYNIIPRNILLLV